MFDLDQMHEVFQSLRRNKLRTFLTALGVFWAVLMLIVMLGFARGLERGAERNFGSWARNACGVWGDQTTKPHAGNQAGRRILFTPQDLEAIRRTVPGLELVIARHPLGGFGGPNRISYRGKTDTFSVFGDEPAYQRIEALRFTSGRFINDADMREARKVAVIGPRVREALYAPGEDPVGTRILVNNVELTVVGAYAPSDSANRWLNGRVFMPRSTLLRTFGLGQRFTSMAMLVAAGHDATAVEERVKALLKRRHRVAPDDPRGVGAFNVAREFGKVKTLFFGISTLAWVVGALTLLAGAIAVGNIMMIAVSERTREIGVRKALGATPARIMAQVVVEAVVLTGLAGYLGLCAGVGVLEIAARVIEAGANPEQPGFFAAPELDVAKAVAAAALLTLAGTAAGLWPARVAAAVRPVEALAHE
jgi:putative ABC transport system permease protein